MNTIESEPAKQCTVFQHLVQYNVVNNCALIVYALQGNTARTEEESILRDVRRLRANEPLH